MSLLDAIFDKTKGGAVAVSLSDVLTETALLRLAQGCGGPGNGGRNRMVVQTLFHELLAVEGAAAGAFVDTLLTNGVQRGRILHDYLPAVACMTGEAWSEDTLTFAEVTLLCGRMMGLARRISNGGPVMLPDLEKPSILLSRPAGEDHVLGLIVLADKLRSAGWTVELDVAGTLVSDISAGRKIVHDAVGLTCHSSRSAARLKSTIATLRRAAPEVFIAVGGGWVTPADDAFGEFGADLAIGPDQNPLTAFETALKSTKTISRV